MLKTRMKQQQKKLLRKNRKKKIIQKKLSLIWKIVLVFEVLGSDGGVGFRIATFFQFFDIKGVLSYSTAFIAVVFAFEYLIVRPLERRILRWREER